MRKLLLLSLVSLALTWSLPAQADTKIGIMNSQELVAKCNMGKRIAAELEALQKSKQAELEAKQQAARKLQQELASPALSPSAQQQKAEELERQQTNLKRAYQDAEREVQRVTQEKLAEMESKILPLINEYGKKKDYDVILDVTRSGVVYFKGTVEITDDLVKEIDKTLK